MKPFNMVDLFSGAGGTAMGFYQAAPFRIVGVDINPQPRYPFTFRQDDVMELLSKHIDVFKNWADVINAAPPCQGYSVTRHKNPAASSYPLLISVVRELIAPLGIPYVIENVEDARWDMVNPVTLCGSSFGLRVRRHRLFESNMPLTGLPCEHRWQDNHRPYKLHLSASRGGYRMSGVQPVYGGGQNVGGDSLRLSSTAMGIDWMTEKELNQAIPPAYTRHLGKQVYDYLMKGTSS